MAGRKVNTNVGKIEIERYENSLFFLRSGKDPWIRITCQLLIEHGMNVVTALPQQNLGITWEILVEFEPSKHPCHQAGIGTIRSRAKSAA